MLLHPTVAAPLLAGATGSSYNPSTAATGTLYYYCIVTNSNGCTVTSNVSGAITVNALPSFTTQPSTAAQTFCLNATATTLSIAATTGSGSITGYQWYSNSVASNSGGSLIAGAVSPLTLHKQQSPAFFITIVAVTNSNGCTLASNVSGAITINALPAFSVQPSTATQNLCLNSTPTALSVTASAVVVQSVVTSGIKCRRIQQWRHVDCRGNCFQLQPVDGGDRNALLLLHRYKFKRVYSNIKYLRRHNSKCSPSISIQPSTSLKIFVNAFAATALSITAAAGGGSISGYQWYSNTTASNSGVL